jgi:hypothetical protein
MGNKFFSTIIASILLIFAIAVLGCTGSQTTPDNQTSSVSITPTTSPTSSGILPAINIGKTDLLAPYKNLDGTFKSKITDESVNQSYVTAAWAFAIFEVSHPDLKDLDTNVNTNPSIKWSICMYQENKYKSVIYDVNNVKDKSGNNHNIKMTIILRETGDEPKAYVSHATLDGRDLLPTYPTEGLFIIPTRLTIPADKILD